MRMFVRLREILTTHELARQLDDLRWEQGGQGQQIQAIFDTIQNLIRSPEEPKRRIGYPTAKLTAPIAH